MIAPADNRKTVYIAGPMQGVPQFNFPAFDRIRDFLTDMGFRVISPADLDREVGLDPTQPDFDPSVVDEEFLRDAQRRDCSAIIDEADFLLMLPGWTYSTGAKAEYALARWKNIPIYAIDHNGSLAETPKGTACLTM